MNEAHDHHARPEFIASAFLWKGKIDDMATAISLFKSRFFEPEHQERTIKHVADPSKGSNAKRINRHLW